MRLLTQSHRGRLIRATSEGKSFVQNPDSVVVLHVDRRLYWSCMGIPGVQDGCVLTISRLKDIPGRLDVATVESDLVCRVTSHRLF